MTIKELGQEAHEINAANGWEVFSPSDWNQHILKNLNATRFLMTHMALVHSEVSEASEAVRHHDRENFDEELADVMIRVASIAHGLDVNLEAAIVAKLAKNRTRGHRHGGKAV